MTFDNRGGPRKGRPEDTTNAATTIDDVGDEEQLTLWAEAIPAHPLADAEADLRRFVNCRPPKKRGWPA
jgi:hypothetical protein